MKRLVAECLTKTIIKEVKGLKACICLFISSVLKTRMILLRLYLPFIERKPCGAFQGT